MLLLLFITFYNIKKRKSRFDNWFVIDVECVNKILRIDGLGGDYVGKFICES